MEHLCYFSVLPRINGNNDADDSSGKTSFSICQTADANDSDTALDMDKNFLQELRDLKTFSSDKDIADEHKRAVFTELKTKSSKEIAKMFDPHVKVRSRDFYKV